MKKLDEERMRAAIARGRDAISMVCERMELLDGPATLHEAFMAELSDEDDFGGDPQSNLERGVMIGIAVMAGAVLGKDVRPQDLDATLDELAILAKAINTIGVSKARTRKNAERQAR